MSVTDLHTSIYALRHFVKRASCRAMPDMVLEFETHDDRARFIVEFEATLSPSQFEEGRRFGAQLDHLYITPLGVTVRLAIKRPK